MKHTLTRAHVACLVFGLLLSACGSPPQPQGLQSGAGVEVSSSTPKRIVAGAQSTLPLFSTPVIYPSGGGGGYQVAMDAVQELILVGLSVIDGQGKLVPRLAEAVPSAENGLWKVFPDGHMETTWHIKPGAAWHDGTPFTADDLIFTIKVEQDNDVPISHRATLKLIETVEAPDARTVTVNWKRPFIEADALFTKDLGMPMPKHLLEPIYTSEKGKFVDVPYWSTEFVGTGPYKVERWVGEGSVVLEAWDGYVLGRPKIDQIEVKFVPDPNTMIANMMAGAVDVTLANVYTLEQALDLHDQRPAITPVVGVNGWLPMYPQFVNPSPGIVANAQFRQAVLHAIDRQELTDVINRGLAPVPDTFISSQDSVYKAIESSIVRYEYDPRKAAQLIEGLGYSMGPDGVYRDSAGTGLSLTLFTTAVRAVSAQATLSIADYLRRVGMAADLVIIPVQRQNDLEYSATFPSFMVVGSNGGLGSSDILKFRGSNTALPENGFLAGGNYARYMNSELDALIERYVAAIPMPERLGALAGVIRHQTERLTVLPIIYKVTASAFSERLVNVSARDPSSTNTWNAHEWDIQ